MATHRTVCRGGVTERVVVGGVRDQQLRAAEQQSWTIRLDEQEHEHQEG